MKRQKLIQAQVKKRIKKSMDLIEGIFPFTETPCSGQFAQKQDSGKNEINASDLFSMFTADIIKKEVTFTR